MRKITHHRIHQAKVRNVVEMRFGRVRGDGFQLSFVHAGRNSDGEDLDSSRFRQLGFRQRLSFVDVGGSVGDKNYQFSNIGTCSVVFDKHHRAGDLQRTGNIGIPALDVQYAHNFEDAIDVGVIGQIEHDVGLVAECHQADLCRARRDRKILYNTGGKAEHVNFPVVVIRLIGDQTTRLIQQQHQIERRVPTLVIQICKQKYK